MSKRTFWDSFPEEFGNSKVKVNEEYNRKIKKRKKSVKKKRNNNTREDNELPPAKQEEEDQTNIMHHLLEPEAGDNNWTEVKKKKKKKKKTSGEELETPQPEQAEEETMNIMPESMESEAGADHSTELKNKKKKKKKVEELEPPQQEQQAEQEKKNTMPEPLESGAGADHWTELKKSKKKKKKVEELEPPQQEQQAEEETKNPMLEPLESGTGADHSKELKKKKKKKKKVEELEPLKQEQAEEETKNTMPEHLVSGTGADHSKELKKKKKKKKKVEELEPPQQEQQADEETKNIMPEPLESGARADHSKELKKKKKKKKKVEELEPPHQEQQVEEETKIIMPEPQKSEAGADHSTELKKKKKKKKNKNKLEELQTTLSKEAHDETTNMTVEPQESEPGADHFSESKKEDKAENESEPPQPVVPAEKETSGIKAHDDDPGEAMSQDMFLSPSEKEQKSEPAKPRTPDYSPALAKIVPLTVHGSPTKLLTTKRKLFVETSGKPKKVKATTQEDRTVGGKKRKLVRTDKTIDDWTERLIYLRLEQAKLKKEETPAITPPADSPIEIKKSVQMKKPGTKPKVGKPTKPKLPIIRIKKPKTVSFRVPKPEKRNNEKSKIPKTEPEIDNPQVVVENQFSVDASPPREKDIGVTTENRRDIETKAQVHVGGSPSREKDTVSEVAMESQGDIGTKVKADIKTEAQVHVDASPPRERPNVEIPETDEEESRPSLLVVKSQVHGDASPPRERPNVEIPETDEEESRPSLMVVKAQVHVNASPPRERPNVEIPETDEEESRPSLLVVKAQVHGDASPPRERPNVEIPETDEEESRPSLLVVKAQVHVDASPPRERPNVEIPETDEEESRPSLLVVKAQVHVDASPPRERPNVEIPETDEEESRPSLLVVKAQVHVDASPRREKDTVSVVEMESQGDIGTNVEADIQTEAQVQVDASPPHERKDAEKPESQHSQTDEVATTVKAKTWTPVDIGSDDTDADKNYQLGSEEESSSDESDGSSKRGAPSEGSADSIKSKSEITKTKERTVAIRGRGRGRGRLSTCRVLREGKSGALKPCPYCGNRHRSHLKKHLMAMHSTEIGGSIQKATLMQKCLTKMFTGHGISRYPDTYIRRHFGKIALKYWRQLLVGLDRCSIQVIPTGTSFKQIIDPDMPTYEEVEMGSEYDSSDSDDVDDTRNSRRRQKCSRRQSEKMKPGTDSEQIFSSPRTPSSASFSVTTASSPTVSTVSTPRLPSSVDSSASADRPTFSTSAKPRARASLPVKTKKKPADQIDVEVEEVTEAPQVVSFNKPQKPAREQLKSAGLNETGAFAERHFFITLVRRKWSAVSSADDRKRNIDNNVRQLRRILNFSHKRSNAHLTDPQGIKWRDYLKDVDSHIEYFNQLKRKAGFSAETVKNYIRTLDRALDVVREDLLTRGEMTDSDKSLEQSVRGVKLSLKTYQKKNSREISKEVVNRKHKRETSFFKILDDVHSYLKTVVTHTYEGTDDIERNIAYLEKIVRDTGTLSTKAVKFLKSDGTQALLPESRQIRMAWLKATYHLATIILVANGHRPGVAVGMTLDEFDSGVKDESEGFFTFSVKDHKTNAATLADVAIPLEQLSLFSRYRKLRQSLVNDQTKNRNFFTNSEGKELKGAQEALTFINKVLKEKKLKPMTMTLLRMCYSTAAGSSKDDEVRKRVARQLCHTPATSEKYYRHSHTKRAVDQFKTLRDLTEGGETGDREETDVNPWTADDPAMTQSQR